MFERLGVPGRFFRTRIRSLSRYTTPMKAHSPQDKRILEIAEPLAETLGLEIVRVRVMGGKKTTVQIIVAAKKPSSAGWICPNPSCTLKTRPRMMSSGQIPVGRDMVTVASIYRL